MCSSDLLVGRCGHGRLPPAAAQLAAPVFEDSVVGSGQCGRDSAPIASRSRDGAGALASPVVSPLGSGGSAAMGAGGPRSREVAVKVVLRSPSVWLARGVGTPGRRPWMVGNLWVGGRAQGSGGAGRDHDRGDGWCSASCTPWQWCGRRLGGALALCGRCRGIAEGKPLPRILLGPRRRRPWTSFPS